MAMANMKDHERLELLKEIGGTRVYEERRKESVGLLRDCEGKRHRIQVGWRGWRGGGGGAGGPAVLGLVRR